MPVGRAEKLTEVVKTLASPNDEELKKFISDNLTTTPPEEIEAFVNQHYRAAGGKKNVSSEEVQKIKDLIKQQGSLEFRIFANQHMDGVAIKAAEDFSRTRRRNGSPIWNASDKACLPSRQSRLKTPSRGSTPTVGSNWARTNGERSGLNNAAKTTHPNWKKVADGARKRGGRRPAQRSGYQQR